MTSIAPLIAPVERGGRQREVGVREVMNGVLYFLETGYQRRSELTSFPRRRLSSNLSKVGSGSVRLSRVFSGTKSFSSRTQFKGQVNLPSPPIRATP